MTSTTYFLLFVILLFSLNVYFFVMSYKIPIPEFDTVENTELKTQESNFFADHLLSFKGKIKNFIKRKDKLDSAAIETNIQIKKQRSQLKRNLKTLNYITSLEANYCAVKDSKRLKDVINLKESLEREVIRNTKLLNHYKLKAS